MSARRPTEPPPAPRGRRKSDGARSHPPRTGGGKKPRRRDGRRTPAAERRRVAPVAPVAARSAGTVAKTGGVNSVSLIGHLADPPELRTSETGEDVCAMRVAVPRVARGGQREPGVVYVEVVTFGAEAIACAERLKRGDRIGLSGRLERDDYVIAEGERRADHGVLVEQLDLLTEEGSSGALR